MEQSKRDVLRAHRVVITDNLQERRVVEQLFAEGVLDQTDREEIHAETSRFGKCCLLLDKLPRKGPSAFESFLQALRLSGQGFLADKLTGESSTGANLSPSRSFGLPNKVPKFVGRSDVCEEISGLLTCLKTTLVSLIAPPGFGKTAVAITVAHEMLEKGKDVLYVSLRRVDSVDGAAKRLLEVIGIAVDKDPVAQVKSFLSSLKKETMLVLDNAEDLQNASKSACNQFLEEVGQHGKNLVILITSRNPLSVFDFPFKKHHIPLKPLDDEASFFFLKHYAPNISDQLARHFANPKVCGGVPLFLKLTASFLESKTIDPIDLHRKLKNCSHGFLKVKDPNIQEFFSLLKVFYNHLRPEVKKGLSWLAAFPSVFTKMEAKNVLFCKDDYLDFQILLNSLVSHSVVQEEEVDNHQQYSLHPLVQAFCIACREDECKGYNMAIRLFSYHYLALLQQLNDDFITTNCKVAIDKYQMNKANIAHALSASTEDEVLKCYGINVSTETVNFLAKVMNQDEFISTYDKFLEVAETLPDKTLYSECLVSIGFKQLCYYSYKDAHRTTAKMNLQKAHDLQIDLGVYDTECQGHCKCKLGLCTFLAGDRKKGISLIAQGIGVRRKLVRSNHSGKMERMLLAGGFCDLGMALFTSGQHKAALNIWENICLVKYRELLGTHPFTASLLDHIGKIYQALGKPRRAVSLKKESLRMRHLLLGDDNLDTARAYYGLGCALKELGSTQEALEHFKKAREIQYRVIASKEDIERTEQEINSLRGNDAMAESAYRMLQEVHLETPCNILSHHSMAC